MGIESPIGRSSARLNPQKIQSDDFMSGGFDRDQFMKAAIKIKDVMGSMSKCSPEVLAVSQIISGMNYE
mgnify:CR=1 FL=1